VYGITFPEPALMKDYQHRMAEARRRDHRLLGGQQELFFFDRLSPGSCFFQPAGARIYAALQEVRLRPDQALCPATSGCCGGC
jgi:threonyl-tRNA synthetase